MSGERIVAIVPSAPVSGLQLIKVLGTVATLSGLLIVLVYQLTLQTITEQKEKVLENAVRQVIPEAYSTKAFVIDNGLLLPAGATNQNALHVYLGYDRNGDLRGIAASASGQGYADTVKILYGYSPTCECITGFNVISSRETPGFGDKLSKDAEFLANFRSLDARLNREKAELAHPIVTVKHGTKSEPWQLDAISGATVSSRAVGRALNDSASEVLPVLIPHLDELRHRSN